jgi:hypothetical protein
VESMERVKNGYKKEKGGNTDRQRVKRETACKECNKQGRKRKLLTKMKV